MIGRVSANDPARGANELPPLMTIPTTDADQALLFCQALAEFLASVPPASNSSGATWSIDGTSGEKSEQVDRSPTVSVVLPVFEEQENILALYHRLVEVLSSADLEFELIFVDDGSRDGSANLMLGLAEEDKRVVVVELARNFGQQIAISAGLDHARGQSVVIMDADLQDPPEFLPALIDKWREGYDVVYAVRRKREESWLRRASYKAFYRLLRRVANINIPLDSGDFCIMDRRVVEVLTRMPERNRFLRGIRSWIGLKQTGLPFERPARKAGVPKYTVSRLVFLALDGLVSFSYMPLRLISVVGFVTSLISIGLAIFYAIKKLFFALNPPGFATLVVAIFFLAGIQLITIGVIGEYVGRIFEEVKRRPLYIAKRVVGGGR